MQKKYKAMALSCIDPRFQSIVSNFLNKKKLRGKYSSFTIAGGSIGVTSNKFKSWHTTFWENLSASIKLHKIPKLIVINHTDCGVAKIVNGKKKFSKEKEKKIHHDSFIKIKKILKKKYPKIKIDLNIISLNGKIKKFN
jgi:carbonic anhydrase